jgi:hypothetical protein
MNERLEQSIVMLVIALPIFLVCVVHLRYIETTAKFCGRICVQYDYPYYKINPFTFECRCISYHLGVIDQEIPFLQLLNKTATRSIDVGILDFNNSLKTK